MRCHNLRRTFRPSPSIMRCSPFHPAHDPCPAFSVAPPAANCRKGIDITSTVTSTTPTATATATATVGGVACLTAVPSIASLTPRLVSGRLQRRVHYQLHAGAGLIPRSPLLRPPPPQPTAKTYAEIIVNNDAVEHPDALDDFSDTVRYVALFPWSSWSLPSSPQELATAVHSSTGTPRLTPDMVQSFIPPPPPPVRKLHHHHPHHHPPVSPPP